MTPGPIGPRELRWLVVILVAAFGLRIAAVLLFQHAPESDELAYHSMAQSLVAGQGIIDIAGNRAMYNVGYPLFVLAPLYAVIGDDPLAPRIVHCLLGIATVFLCWGLAREAGAALVGRLFTAVFVAAYLPLSVYAVYLFKENLMTPLVVGLLWAALRFYRLPTRTVAALVGALLGLLALTGNAALCLIAPVAWIMWSSPATRGRAVGAFALATVCAGIVVTPWMVRNLEAVGAPVLNTNGGFNLYLGNNPAANGLFISIADTPRAATWPSLRRQGEVFASSVLRADAVAWIRANPDHFAELAIRKAGYFWTPPLHSGQGPQSTIERIVRGAWAIEYLALCVLALGALCFAGLRSRPSMALWLSLLCFTAVHMLFYVAFRYREPIMPLVCTLAALTVEQLLLVGRRKVATLRTDS
jgi:hypothetical protein